MSKNYDLIATVDIDIQSPIVDDASFDNLLILGPGPKNGPKVPRVIPDVGVYSQLGEVEDLGFVTTGKDADPVGVAARVAFSQSPTPTQVYIAIQKPAAGAVQAAVTIREANEVIGERVGKKDNLTGCEINFNQAARRLSISLTGAVTGVKNTGLDDTVTTLTEKGYAVKVGEQQVATVKDLKALPVFDTLSKLKKGDEPVEVVVSIEKEGALPVSYGVTVSYPDPDAPAVAAAETGADAPIDSPDTELEAPAVSIARALGMSGWYVLCSAGIDPSKCEEIAAYIETQEKMFAYTELGFFGAGKDGKNAPAVGNVYYRTLGVYARETTDQADAEIPDANLYENVAFVAKWLNYDTGSETSAFKTLSGVYPSVLTSTEMKLLAEANLNYFITVGNKNITMNGKVMAGEWADIIRFRDWLKNDMQVRVVNLFVTRPKVPYTDSGIGLVQNQMIAALKAGQDRGGIAESEFDEDGTEIPGYVTSVPLSSSLSASEKASRKLTRCKFKARLAGAIHFAELKGSLTYEL